MNTPDLRETALPTNRSFGALFVVVFALLALWSWWHGAGWHFLWGALAIATLVVTLAAPQALTPFNRLWMRFAGLLNRVVSPIMLGAIFFGVVMPFGLIMRLAGRDPMALRFEPGAMSYWIERKPPGPDPKSITQQF